MLNHFKSQGKQKEIKFLSLSAILLFACSVFGQEKPTAFINAKIIPIIGQPIEQGILLIQNGKIKAVGDARAVRLSSDVQTIDLQGKVLMPGLVDTQATSAGRVADGSSRFSRMCGFRS